MRKYFCGTPESACSGAKTALSTERSSPLEQQKLRKQWGFKEPWIGVDLDGTLAQSHSWYGYKHIGDPIPKMIKRVKRLQERGIEVRIFTSRVEGGKVALRAIRVWCIRNGLGKLKITNVKDSGMVEIWDDLAVRVEENTGRTCCKYKPNWKTKAVYGKTN